MAAVPTPDPLKHLLRALAPLPLCLAASGCLSFGGSGLPKEPPPLFALQEPPALQGEPQDEDARRELPAGSFSGVYVSDARRSLEAMLDQPEGLLVQRLVENSPADAAGLEPGDLLLEVTPAGGEPLELRWPSEWRGLELELPAGTELELVYDRAGAVLETRLTLVERVHPAEREEVERLREEQRVGLVVRGATEVEARALGLGPGAGAVVVGLSGDSPWRGGVRYEDLIVAAGGRAVAHPQALVDAIRAADEQGTLTLELVRDGERREVELPISRRARELRHLRVPLLFSYEKDRDRRTTSMLLGLFRHRVTPAAWDLRLLWVISLSGGDADRLQEVEAQ
jgi:hypothetical protein